MQYSLKLCLYCADVSYVLGKDGGLIPIILENVHV